MKSKPTAKGPGTVLLKDLTNMAMSTGGSKRHPVVIIHGHRKQWVGIGWVDEGPATSEDRAKYPEAK